MNASKIALLTILAIIIPFIRSTNDYKLPTYEQLENLRNELIDSFKVFDIGPNPLPLELRPVLLPFAGSVLRLSFHDCGGPPEFNEPSNVISKCDGCVEMDNFESHQNIVLRSILPLEDIYRDSKWYEVMGRGDFWMFAATVALEFTQQNSDDNDVLPHIPYYFGRNDCSTSPDLDNRVTKPKPFPIGHEGWDETFIWYRDNFGFTETDGVAILGAHTIGRAHPDDSGFTSPWVLDWGKFNNGFYQDIINKHWVQATANNNLKEWRNDRFMMLNTDISMYKELDGNFVDDRGTVSCTFDQCPNTPESFQIVEKFADNNQAFLNAFASAFTRMITMGYDVDKELTAVVNPATSKPVTTDKPATTPYKPSTTRTTVWQGY